MCQGIGVVEEAVDLAEAADPAVVIMEGAMAILGGVGDIAIELSHLVSSDFSVYVLGLT